MLVRRLHHRAEPSPRMPSAITAHPSLSAELLRAQLVALVPGLEIVMARALGSGDDARDGVQEVLARALHAIESGRPIRDSLASFVYGIAAHVIVDMRRAQARMRVADLDADSLPASATDPLELLIDDQRRLAMREALGRLDGRDLELLQRCYLDGERTSDIARREGVPASRVRKRKSRALQQLRAWLNVATPSHTSSPGATTEE